jgi:hypothetical protein
LKLAQGNLQDYPLRHEALDVAGVRTLIALWLEKLESGRFEVNPLQPATAPRLDLVEA